MNFSSCEIAVCSEELTAVVAVLKSSMDSSRCNAGVACCHLVCLWSLLQQPFRSCVDVCCCSCLVFLQGGAAGYTQTPINGWLW